ncbi:hypothetical protein ACFFJ7_20380 [Pseudochelatococcus lubricantis]|uniref:hypothetical protein n=1 Tax=Pseudochelatococcus lubricantis TaxID=1538102 RepID=UPI0035E9E864
MVGPVQKQQIQNHAAAPPNNASRALGFDLRRAAAARPQDIDLRVRNVIGKLSTIMTGAAFDFSSTQKAEFILHIVGNRLASTQIEYERLEHALQEPEQLKALLKHKSEDCGGSAVERMSNRALLLLDLAAGVDPRSLKQRKEVYLNLSPAERKTCLQLPSAAMRGAFIDLSADMRGVVVEKLSQSERECCLGLSSAVMRGAFLNLPPDLRGEAIKLSRTEREAVMASPNAGQLLEERRYKQLYKDLYTRNGIPWIRDTRPAIVSEGLKKLGSGAFNTVFCTKIDTPDGTRGVVIKPLNNSVFGTASQAIGIVPPPHYELRNIATSLVAKRLGFDVVVDTQLCLYKSAPERGYQSRLPTPAKVGIMMEFAQGRAVYAEPVRTLGNANVRCEMTKLQLVDAIVGQADRHNANMLIYLGGGKAVVKGIDNDQCFGIYPSNPDNLYQPHDRFGTRRDNGLRGVRLPGVIDSGMASAINKLRPADLQAMLSDKLSQAECRAAVNRLNNVKAHVERLVSAGRVIAPEQWSHSPLVNIYCNRENSYFARAIAQRERII